MHEGHKVLIVNSHKGYRESMIKGLSRNIVFLKEAKAPIDIIPLFVTSKRELGEQLGRLKPLLESKSMFWVTCPKGASKIQADINRDTIRQQAQTLGLEAVERSSRWITIGLLLG